MQFVEWLTVWALSKNLLDHSTMKISKVFRDISCYYWISAGLHFTYLTLGWSTAHSNNLRSYTFFFKSYCLSQKKRNCLLPNTKLVLIGKVVLLKSPLQPFMSWTPGRGWGHSTKFYQRGSASKSRSSLLEVQMYPFRAESPCIGHYRDYLALPRAMNLKKQSRTGSCIQFFLVPLNDQVLGTLATV